MHNNDKQSKDPEFERRENERIKKSFILSYFELKNPDVKIEITQLKNISLGGMCFVTTQDFEPFTKLGIELKTPYIAGTTCLEGSVMASHEKMTETIFETRLKFDPLDTEAKILLEKMMRYFIETKDQIHE